jgi:deoxyribodipyrimidine photo-lyase
VSERYERSIVWLRRDLRLADNVALFEAARASKSICLAFVLDPSLLRGDRVGAPIVQSFFGALCALRADLRARASDLALLEGDCARELGALAGRIGAQALFYNEDYEPDAIARDARVTRALRAGSIDVYASLDHVYFGAGDVTQPNGNPYAVFTPYKKRWLDRHASGPKLPVPSARAIEGTLLGRPAVGATLEVPAPEAYGHAQSERNPHANEATARALLDRFLRAGGGVDRYAERRDLPALRATSYLSPQLRAGTIGIRTCVERAFAALGKRDRAARNDVETWIAELIWRDFYHTVLRMWPHVAAQPFLDAARGIAWRSSEHDFRVWCAGRTGYPIVDAAMHQINTYGWMHNRLRMIVASFLTKDLLIDWRKGERYFEQHLADGDMAANNGGWQWAASTGTDAAPYFRIFNPVLQSKKFDAQGTFIRAMLPELRRVPDKYVHAPWEMPPIVAAAARCEIGKDYPAPIVDHARARARALEAFAVLATGARRANPH